MAKRNKIQMKLAPGLQEVRRNMASFNFVVKEGMFYRDGLKTLFVSGTANGYQPMKFPVNAIEIKASWKIIDPAMKPQYHWNYDASGKLYGLIALHIITKAVPNWTWATWEWSDNPGRCDFTGCYDSFGVNPSNIQPNVQPGKGYPEGQLTAPLLEIFKKYGLTDEWQHYRLKGSQTNWTDPTGLPTLLGNSILERPFVSTSSCITCHAYASFDSTATGTGPQFKSNGDSYNGPVDPKTFWPNGPAPAGRLKFYPADFTWSFSIVINRGG